MAHLAKAAVLAAPAYRTTFVGHLQRRAVQVGVEPVNLTAALVSEMIHPRQRAPGFIRVINICTAQPGLLLLLQQAVALPQEARFGGAVRGSDDFAGTAAQRVVVIARLKPPFRPGSAGGYQPVLGVIRIMLFIQPVAAADQVAPVVVFHKQRLPVLQAVIHDRYRIVIGGEVIRGVIAELRAAVPLSGLVVLQQTPFGVVAVVHLTAQGVADTRKLTACGVAIQAFQYRLLRQGHLRTQLTALQGTSAKAVILTELRARALGAADLAVQAVAGELGHQLLPEADGADVAGAIVQPGQLLLTGQRQAGQVAQGIPFIAHRAVNAGFAQHAPGGIMAVNNFIAFDTQRNAFGCWDATDAGDLAAQVTDVAVLRVALSAPDQQPAVVIAELQDATGDAAVGGRSAVFFERAEEPSRIPFHMAHGLVRARFAERAAHGVIGEAVFRPVAVIESQQVTARVVAPLAHAANTIGEADRETERVIGPAYLAFQRVAPARELAAFVPHQRLAAAVRMDHGTQQPGVVPLPTRDIPFRILAGNQLPETVVTETGHAAGAIGALCQQPLDVPDQTYHAAEGISDALRQVLFLIGIVIRGGVTGRIRFRQQTTAKVVHGLR